MNIDISAFSCIAALAMVTGQYYRHRALLQNCPVGFIPVFPYC